MSNAKIKVLKLPDELKLNFFDLKLEDKNIIYINPQRADEMVFIIKQWIASTLAKHYDKDPIKMNEARKHLFRYVSNSLLHPSEAILVTNNQNYVNQARGKEINT